MRRIIFIAMFLALLMPALAFAAPVRTVAQVYVPNARTMEYLRTFQVGFQESGRPDYAQIITDRETIDELRAAGFEVEILIEDVAARVAARNSYIRSMPPEVPPKGKVVLDHFLTHAEMTTYLNDMAAAYPDLMTVEVIGSSVEDRDLFLVKISDNVEVNEPEPAFFFEGTAHGDELAGYMLDLHIIEWLLTNYGVDDELTELVNTREIFIEPLTNPDGNYDGGIWGRMRENAHGVDLNRNFGYMWTNREFEPGSSILSEPETQAITDVWMRPQPFAHGISWHGGAVVYSYPWSYHPDAALEEAEFDYLGNEYIYPRCQDPNMDIAYQGYWGMYQALGVTKDMYLGTHGSMAATIELSYNKQLSWSDEAQLVVDHEPALRWIIKEIGYGLQGMVTDTDTGDPVPAVIEFGNKWPTFNDYEVGDYHKYLRPGTYDVRVWANGYQDFTTSVNILDSQTTTLDVQLEPDPEPTTFAYRWVLNSFPNDDVTHTKTKDALGMPDGKFVSIGFHGFAVVDLGPDGISNGAGNDLAIYEGHTDGAETVKLYKGDTWFGPWSLIGTAVGSAELDLGAAGIDNVRYIKIEDQHVALDDPSKAGQYDGYDLDAIGTPIFICSFSGNPVTGARPLEVQFTDNSTGNPDTWAWDFGDGDTSTDQNPVHTYTELGTYTVSLTINGSGGEADMVREDYIVVYEGEPVAAFTGTPTTGPAPLEVTFADESTGMIDTYLWNFGDGDTSDEASPTHTYENTGNFTVRLTVHGPGGSNTKTRWNYIHATEPTDDDTTPIDDDTADDDTADDDTADDDTADDDTTPADDDTTPVDDDTVPDDDTTPSDDDIDDDDTTDDDVSDDDSGDDDDDNGCGC